MSSIECTLPEFMSEYTGFTRSVNHQDSLQNPAKTHWPKILEK